MIDNIPHRIKSSNTNPTKNEDYIKCSGRVCSSCSKKGVINEGGNAHLSATPDPLVDNISGKLG